MPSDPVQAQLDAYNARDIEAFAACYADDVRVYDLDANTERFRGLDELRARYGPQFINLPQQRAKVVSRQRVGLFTVDVEFVTGSGERPDAHVIAIYRVDGTGAGAKIDRVWFSPRG
jgi:hypothetical protein